MSLLIKGARVVDPASGRDGVGNVLIEGERIAALGAEAAQVHADQTIDAAGLVVSPGLIDLCARLREPELSVYWSDLYGYLGIQFYFTAAKA